jgi:hypothetical protein
MSAVAANVNKDVPRPKRPERYGTDADTPRPVCSTASHRGSGHDPSIQTGRTSRCTRPVTTKNRSAAGCGGPGHLNWLLFVYETGSRQRYGLRGHLTDGVLPPGRVNTDDHRPRGRTTFREGPPIWETAGLLFCYDSIGPSDARPLTRKTSTNTNYYPIAVNTRKKGPVTENFRIALARRITSRHRHHRPLAHPSHATGFFRERPAARGDLRIEAPALTAMTEQRGRVRARLSESSIHAVLFPNWIVRQIILTQPELSSALHRASRRHVEFSPVCPHFAPDSHTRT